MTSAVQEWQLDFERAMDELKSFGGRGEAWQVGLNCLHVNNFVFSWSLPASHDDAQPCCQTSNGRGQQLQPARQASPE